VLVFNLAPFGKGIFPSREVGYEATFGKYSNIERPGHLILPSPIQKVLAVQFSGHRKSKKVINLNVPIRYSDCMGPAAPRHRLTSHAVRKDLDRTI
jgi:hypothetical protein